MIHACAPSQRQSTPKAPSGLPVTHPGLSRANHPYHEYNHAPTPRVPESEDALVEGWEKYPGPLKLTGQYTGEYQPATSSAPAQNVPKPLEAVPHRDEPTFEGAYETLRAYYSALITTLKDGHYASQAVELIHPEDRSAIAEINAVKELYEQKGWYMEFTCSISMQKTEPVGAVKDGDGYVRFMLMPSTQPPPFTSPMAPSGRSRPSPRLPRRTSCSSPRVSGGGLASPT